MLRNCDPIPNLRQDFKRNLEIALGNKAPPFWHEGMAQTKLPIDKNTLKGSTAFHRAPL